MNLTRRILVASVLLSLNFSLVADASAQNRVISQAYEVMLDDFQAPNSIAGVVTFRSCPQCDSVSVHATAATRYSISGELVRLDEFREIISQVKNKHDISVTVLHHLESNSIESIDASL